MNNTIFVWDHFDGQWCAPTSKELSTYQPPKDGQLLGEVESDRSPGRFFARTAQQNLSNFTGQVKVGQEYIFFKNGEVESYSPSCGIVAGFIAVQLGCGQQSGRAYGRNWECC